MYYSRQGSYRHSNSYFQDLQRPNSRVFQDSKSVIGVSASKKRSRNANNISNNRFDRRGGTVLKLIAYAYLLSDYPKTEMKKPRSAALEFQEFPWFSRT